MLDPSFHSLPTEYLRLMDLTPLSTSVTSLAHSLVNFTAESPGLGQAKLGRKNPTNVAFTPMHPLEQVACPCGKPVQTVEHVYTTRHRKHLTASGRPQNPPQLFNPLKHVHSLL